jgi:serine kinase of HPr protein (carbohydrate metabolism regulator)
MKKKLSLKVIFQGKIISLGIKEIIPATGWGKQLSKINIRLISRVPFSPLKNNVPTIAIITPRALSRLFIMKETLCRQMPDIILNNNIVFIVLANSLSIPAFFKNLIANINIPVAASKYDEHYLRSLLQALIREKFQQTICLHGVVMEAKEMGILITGASGIGKTTAALKMVAKDYYWVADDVAVIKRSKHGQLIASGHKKINNYLHTEATGIIPVRNLLKPDRIKVNTKLAAVLEVEKAGIRDIRIIKGEKEILGVKLTCLHINIPSTSSSYFNEKLLKKSLRQLSKDN